MERAAHGAHVTTETILVDVDAGVCTITINRPDHFNAMTNQMARELHDTLVAVGDDRSVRIVVLTAAGDRSFCPGADATAMTASAGAGAAAVRTPDARIGYRIPGLLYGIPQFTIAALNGSAAGAGLGWALACDVRWAADTARFTTAFLDRGVAGDMAVHWTLPRLVGPGRARQLMLLPDKLSAAEAHALGMVDAVFTAATFRDDVARLVERLRSAAPLALRAMKANLLDGERMTIGQLSDVETDRHFELMASDDVREGFAAFSEHRPPRFHGR